MNRLHNALILIQNLTSFLGFLFIAGLSVFASDSPQAQPKSHPAVSRPAFQPDMDMDTAAGWYRARATQRPMAVSHGREQVNALGPQILLQPRSYSGRITKIGSRPDQVYVNGILVLVMNVSGDGSKPEAMAWLHQIVHHNATMICRARLSTYGTEVCSVNVEIDGNPTNIGAKMLQLGWVGWQSEVGYSKDLLAHKAAKSAFEQARGVWSDPMYFPPGIIRTGPTGQS